MGGLRQLGQHFLLFIVTNQPGIARGLISRREADFINAQIISRLAQEGIQITDIYVCPHDRLEKCVCIKPNPYFLHEAARKHQIDLQRSFVIGDHPSDIELARHVGARGIFVLTGHGRKHLPELTCPAEVVEGITQAAERIMYFCNSL